MGNDHPYSVFPFVHLNAGRQRGGIEECGFAKGEMCPKLGARCMADQVLFKLNKSHSLILLGFAFGRLLWLEMRAVEGIQASSCCILVG